MARFTRNLRVQGAKRRGWQGSTIPYLNSEPLAKLGFWTNRGQSLAIHKTIDGNWLEIRNAALPTPDDDLTKPPSAPISWNSMSSPAEADLTGAFKRLLNTVVANDTRSVRAEARLGEIVNVLLVKLDSDANAVADPDEPVAFAVRGDEATRAEETAMHVRALFRELFARRRSDIFGGDDRDDLRLDNATIYEVVVELSRFRLLFVEADVVGKAFQIFRAQALQIGEGQFLTPLRVVRPCVMAMEVQVGDKIIDPASGTGGS